MRFRVVCMVLFNIMRECVNRMGLTPEVDINVFGSQSEGRDRSSPSRDRGGVTKSIPLYHLLIVLTAPQHPFF